MDDLRNFWYYTTYADTEEQLRLSSDIMFRELTNRLSNAASGESEVRFALYSGHDSSLISYLTWLGSDIRNYPVFSSQLIIELWDDDTVKLKYNDEPLVIPGCSGECKLDEFLGILSSKFVHDREKQCIVEDDN